MREFIGSIADSGGVQVDRVRAGNRGRLFAFVRVEREAAAQPPRDDAWELRLTAEQARELAAFLVEAVKQCE